MCNIWNKARKQVDVDVWDHLVTSTYGRFYKFQQQVGCRERGIYSVDAEHPYDHEADTIPEEINGRKMGVSFKAWLRRDPKEWNGEESKKHCLELFWARNFYPDETMIAEDLYKRGLIDSLDFDIIVDW